MDARQKEWYDLKEWERNSLVWADLLEWHEPHKVLIRRQDLDDSIGLVTTAVQDQMTKDWYNIIKQTKENHPVHNHVNRYEWVFEVDGTTTTNCPSDKFCSLVKNGKKEILLSLKKTVDPLSKFQKEWVDEKTVTLKLKSKNDKKILHLHHFYSKKDNEEIKDHILISEINVDLKTLTSEPLQRGDELLAVNGQQLKKREKLAEIWGRISCKIPAEVELTIKKIQPKKCNDKEVVVNCRDMAPEIEGHLNSPNASMSERDVNPKCDNPTQLKVVEQETDTKAGRNENEAYVKDPSDCESRQASRLDTTEEDQGENDIGGENRPIQETSKTRRLFSLTKRLSLKGSSGGNKVENEELTSKDRSKVSALKNENGGYADSPQPVRKFSPTSDKLCDTCVMTNGIKQQADNRDEWPIDKIELRCFDEFCKVIDLSDRTNTPIISTLNFTSTEAAKIMQEFATRGGQGVAKKALGIWGVSDPSHNVGALKKILKYEIKRFDALREIETWEKMSVCHGCGIKIKHSPKQQQ